MLRFLKIKKQISYAVKQQPHPFNGLFSRTTWTSRCQKGKTSLDLNKAKDDGVLGWQWHQLDHTQTICTSLQTDNHTNTSSLNIFTGQTLFLTPNQQCQRRKFTSNFSCIVTGMFSLNPGGKCTDLSGIELS